MPGRRRARGSLCISSLGVARAVTIKLGRGGAEKRVAGWIRPHHAHGTPGSLTTRWKPGPAGSGGGGSARRVKVAEPLRLETQRAGTGPRAPFLGLKNDTEEPRV